MVSAGSAVKPETVEALVQLPESLWLCSIFPESLLDHLYMVSRSAQEARSVMLLLLQRLLAATMVC